MKKILFVCNTSWGVFNFRLGLIKTLQKAGFEVHVLAPEDKTSYFLKEEGVHFHSIYIDNKGTSPIKDFSLLCKLYKIYKKISPDLIFHYTIKPNIYGSIAAKLANIKSIAFVTGAGHAFNKSEGWLSLIVEKLFSFALNFPVRVWFLNKEDTNLFVDKGLVDSYKVEILPSEGINTEFFIPENSVRKSDKISFL